MTTQTSVVAEDPGAGPQQAEQALRSLADWGMDETGATTLGELIEEIRRSGEKPPHWEEIAGTPLYELATPSRSLIAALEAWTKGLPEAEQAVFWGRMTTRNGEKTLRELASQSGVYPSTVSAREAAVREKLTAFMNSQEGGYLQRRVEIARQTIGAALREDAANEALELYPGDPCRDLLLSLSGPYRKDGEWLVLERMIDTDPTEDLLRSASEAGWLSERLVAYRLDKWGLEPEKHRDWITRDGRIREFRGRLVRWGRNLAEQALMALDDLGVPATAQEIQEHLGGRMSVRSVHVALSRDPRLVRTGPRLWGLRSWNLPQYHGIVHHMRETLRERGEMPIAELFQMLTTAFGTGEENMRAAAQKPDFVTSGDTIRLRNEWEDTYREDVHRLDCGKRTC